MVAYGDGNYGDGPYGGAVFGKPFLVDALGADASIIVEIAFGANLMDDASSWEWTDVTGDVRVNEGIETTLGRADEASTTQPASCSFVLDNDSGNYSLGGQSVHYPKVRRNVPVRITVIDAVVFFGFANGFTPTWDVTGKVRAATVSASGVLRRLIQGASPLVSPLRRGLTDQANTIAYWPGEEAKNAAFLAPVVGGRNMTYTGAPKFGEITVFDASDALGELNGAILVGTVPDYPDNGTSQVRMLLSFPREDAATGTNVLFSVYTSGTAARWDVCYVAGGDFNMFVYDRFGTQIFTPGAVDFNVNDSGRFYSLQMTQDGTDVDWTVRTISQYTNLGQITGTVTGYTFGVVTGVVINPSGVFTDVGFGHIIVQNDVTSLYDIQAALDANSGDWAFERATRLCEENNIPFEVFGDGIGGAGAVSIADAMGPQSIDTLVNLLREAETVDQGILFDGTSAGLSMRNRYYRENRTPILTIDAAQTQLAAGFGATDDDQRNRNRVEANRSGGASALVEDVEGPLGTATIGIYDSSITINALRDDSMQLYAGWLVSLGTVEGYRYPVIMLDFLATPELAPQWVKVIPGTRIDIINIPDALPEHPDGVLSLMVEGVTNTFTGDTWVGKAQCSPYEPWRIATIAEESGDTTEYLMRPLSDGSSLAFDHNMGDLGIIVDTPSGPLWTTDVDDYPLTLAIGGIAVIATACTGTTSPQTFTTEPLPMAWPAGTEVTVYRPTRLGL